MTEPFENQFVAELLRCEGPRLAVQTARRLARDHPEAYRRDHPLPILKWRESLAGRITDLAAAIAAGRPELFCAQIAWAKISFTARGIPLDDLAASLDALRGTIPENVPPEDRPLVLHYLDRARAGLPAAPTHPPPVLRTGAPHGETAARYLLALLEGERLRACRVVAEAATHGADYRQICRHVFTPVLRELGRMWHLAEITVAEEHFASVTTVIAMAQLCAGEPRGAPRGRTLLAACVEGNTHEIGARMLADWFELEGWRVVHLGADVPTADLILAAKDFSPDLIALSASLCVQLPTAADAIALLRATLGDAAPRILVGGAAIEAAPDLWRQYGADAFAVDADDALDAGHRLCSLSGPGPRRPPGPHEQ